MELFDERTQNEFNEVSILPKIVSAEPYIPNSEENIELWRKGFSYE